MFGVVAGVSAARVMFALAAVAIILLGATAAFGSAAWESGDETEVVNETFSADGGTTVELEHSKQANTQYSATVNVTNTSETVVYEPDGNYTWHDGNGTITVTSGSDLASETDAHISYSFSENSAEAYGMLQLFAKVTGLGDAIVLALAAATVLAAARVFGGAG